MGKLVEAFQLAETIINAAFSSANKVQNLMFYFIKFSFVIFYIPFLIFKGYIIQKREKRPKEEEEFFTNQEFHPMIFEQHKDRPFLEYDNFDKAVDEFFSNMESQKIDVKGVQQVIHHIYQSNWRF